MSAESLLGGFYDGLRLATMVVCLGAANALANPKRLLKAMPPALYEVGTAVIVALSVFPQLAESVIRVRRARKLRGGSGGKRFRALHAIIIPVLEDALDRSLQLAASMDSRGYGRAGTVQARARLVTGLLMIIGLLGVCVGVYATLDGTTPRFLAGPVLFSGSAVALVGFRFAGKRVHRTRYRPDRWQLAEVVVEHRMERVIPFADRMIFVPGDGTVVDGTPPAVLVDTPIAPPIVRLGRLAGWDPLPMSVRDARRQAGPLRAKLPAAPVRPVPTSLDTPLLTSSGVVVRYGPTVAVRGVDLDLHGGKVVAVMGRNGSGKSSLLWALQGSGPRQSGTVNVAGTDPRELSSAKARKVVGLVPQTASDLLYLETVAAECTAADIESGVAPGFCRGLLDRLAPGIDPDKHPRDLSEGQRLALVLAVQLSAAPRIMLLDEPTRGLDYTAKSALRGMIATLAAEGRAVVVATHDVEFVATVADRVIVMAEGEIVSDGPTVEVLGGSPAFATQVAKILGESWLTVADVEGVL